MRLVVIGALLIAPGAVACGQEDKASRSSDVTFDREVAVNMEDTLRFDPSRISAKPGEKVKFLVTNKGRTQHEFAIGDDSFHDELNSMTGGHGGHDDTNVKGSGVVVVEPGKSGELVYTMPDEAPTFVCYVANHDEGGMKGSVEFA